jgi:hypothetical protein
MHTYHILSDGQSDKELRALHAIFELSSGWMTGMVEPSCGQAQFYSPIPYDFGENRLKKFVDPQHKFAADFWILRKL